MEFRHYQQIILFYFFKLVNLVAFGISDAMGGYFVRETQSIVVFFIIFAYIYCL